MGKGSSRAPEPPDPYETASTAAQFQQLNTYNPGGGGLRYGYTNEAGEFVPGMAPEGYRSAQTYVESPIEQRIREIIGPASERLTQHVAERVNNLPGPATPGNFEAVAQQIYNTGLERMQPQFEAENNRMLANLQARGIPVGSEAFGDAYGQQQRAVNEALSNLSMQSTLAAGQEQSRQFGIDTTARQNAISEIVAAMGGAYTPTSPQQLTGQGPSVDYAGLVQNQYNAQLQQHNQQQQQRNASLGALGSLGGAMLMKSDRRLKTDIVRIGRRGPLNLYAYRYVWDDPGTMRTGYMAQEVLALFPQAVRRVKAWFHLDYSILPEV